jgi:hypothetical protein
MTKEAARQKAIDFQNWQAEQKLSWSEVIKWHSYFVRLAMDFKLRKEFQENGII